MGTIRALSIVGARPQFIKAAALDRALAGHGDITHDVLHTGQHYDDQMSRVFFEELGLKAGADLGVGSGVHGAQTARMIEGIEAALSSDRPEVVLLYGDTNSTLAGAIAASKLRVPIAHIEAGLRSFWKHMPEEVNRVLCDHCSTWLFCPTGTAAENLFREGFARDGHAPASMDAPRVVVTGDVMYDNCLHYAGLAAKRSQALRSFGLEREGYILATVHRDHNTDDPHRLQAILQALVDAAAAHGMPVALPLHPRTRDRLTTDMTRSMEQGGVHLLPPLGYLDMIALEHGARLIITDSGGVQKEAYFLERPCVVLRPVTEWVELVQHGQAMLADADPQRIKEAIARFMAQGRPDCPPLYGDGHAADRIVHELMRDLR